MQEYYCSRTVALAGSFYKEQLAQLEEEGRCFNFNPPMYTQWYCSVDVGIVDLMVLWFGYVYDNKFISLNAMLITIKLLSTTQT